MKVLQIRRMKLVFFKTMIAIPVLVAALSVSMAQTSRAEQKRVEKEWRKKAKQYVKNPTSLKNKEEGYQMQIQELISKNNELLKKYNDMRTELDKAENSMRAAENQNISMKNEIERLRTAYETTKQQQEKHIVSGIVYKVQIGAFKNFDMTKYIQEKGEGHFEGESADNLNKYTIGQFRDLEVAEAFKKDLRKLGIKDAFIVAYSDGKRITLEEARGGGRVGGDTKPRKPAPNKRKRPIRKPVS